MTKPPCDDLETWRARRDEAFTWLVRNGDSGQHDWLQAELKRYSDVVAVLEVSSPASNLALTLAEQIEKSRLVRDWLVRSGRNLSAQQSARLVCVAASMQVALEHHGAILLLAKDGFRASLLALLRCIYEAYVWSAWLFRIASEDQLLELAHNRLRPDLERMIGALDRQRLFDRPMLLDMKELIKRMNGFVHGGYHHLQYRIHKDGVEARYPDDLIIDALRFADLFAVMTLLEWPAMTADIELGDRLYAEAQSLLGLGPNKFAKPSAHNTQVD